MHCELAWRLAKQPGGNRTHGIDHQISALGYNLSVVLISMIGWFQVEFVYSFYSIFNIFAHHINRGAFNTTMLFGTAH